MKKILIIVAALIMAGCSSQLGAETAEETQAPNNEQQVASVSVPSSESKVEIIKDNRTGIVPVTIEIPAINVKTQIEQVGTLKNGRMDVPKNPDNVGWYEPGTLPGAPGNAVLAGHVDDLTSPAVFYDLHKLKNGDKIMVTDAEGQTLTFEVYEQKAFPRLDAPIEDIFGFSFASTLNLITCSGDFDPETTERAERTVIYTKLVEDENDRL
ncbi:class F sortase [Mesobacillus subterraneus]|uniref:class F sortase n=1 Tax=Mesobacillus subterraneus TaxID=285983 RepID=UPI001CFC9CD4|nr:class F sortase [Mesobacillus subterraneus]